MPSTSNIHYLTNGRATVERPLSDGWATVQRARMQCRCRAMQMQSNADAEQSNHNEQPSDDRRRAAAPACVPGFEEFWSAYPAHRRGPKPDARDAWAKHVRADQAGVALQALLGQFAWPEVARENYRFMPHAHRWLKKQRWEDVQAPAENGMPDGPTRSRVNQAWAGRTEAKDVKL